MKMCQNPYCYQYDRMNNERTIGGKKYYTNTKATNLNYFENFCTQRCLNDFLNLYISRIINFIGKLEKSKIREVGSPSYYHKNNQQLQSDFNSDKTY